MSWDVLLFWRSKQASDNEWRPRPGHNPIVSTGQAPAWLKRMDFDAACVDAGPFIAGVGGFTHMVQLNQLGWTVPASIFRNTRTMTAMYRAAIRVPALFLVCQAAQVDYRSYIPRWCHDRERRRDELDVRQHVQAGEVIGLGIYFIRMLASNATRPYWSPLLEVVMAGALSDLLNREYWKAHGL